MAVSQNCAWNVPRCSARMERRGFATGLVPDLDVHVEAAHACCRSFSLLNCTTSLLYTCSTQVCLAWLVRALARTRPVASVTHRLPCEAVHSASDLSRTSHLLLWGRLCPRVARFFDCQLAAAKHIPTITQQSR